MTTTKFAEWLDTFVDEKGFDLEQTYKVEGEDWGANYIPLGCVIEFIKTVDAKTQAQIKTNLVKIDFLNGDCHHFFTYMAKGMAL